MDAIIYTTNAGSTERYAKLLGHETGLPVYSLTEAKKMGISNVEIIYLGWIMAGKVQGYSSASKQYKVSAVCAVGMCQTGTQTENVREKTEVPENIPLFTLQGDFDVEKLHGIYRIMMKLMVKTAGKSLAAKENRTPEEDNMLGMMFHGSERVKFANLSAVLTWYRAENNDGRDL